MKTTLLLLALTLPLSAEAIGPSFSLSPTDMILNPMNFHGAAIAEEEAQLNKERLKTNPPPRPSPKNYAQHEGRLPPPCFMTLTYQEEHFFGTSIQEVSTNISLVVGLWPTKRPETPTKILFLGDSEHFLVVQTIDEIKRAAEQCREKVQTPSLKDQALDKLTAEERKALGL